MNMNRPTSKEEHILDLVGIDRNELREAHARCTLEVIGRHAKSGLDEDSCHETLQRIKMLLEKPEFK